jgi:hypothetical protein
MIKKLFVMTSIIFLLPCTSFASDRCSPILAQGIRDHYNFTSQESLENHIYTAVCKKSFNSRNLKSQFSLDIPIPQLNAILGFGDNSSSEFQRRVDFCNNANSKISHSAAKEFSENTINKAVIDAWKSCISSIGLYCEAENINDSHFRIKVSWDPSHKAPEPTIYEDLRIIGGSCEKVQRLPKYRSRQRRLLYSQNPKAVKT